MYRRDLNMVCTSPKRRCDKHRETNQKGRVFVKLMPLSFIMQDEELKPHLESQQRVIE